MAPNPDDFLSRYEMLQVIGQGSYGQVIKCVDTVTRQYVAVKKFIDDDRSEATAKRIAQREVRMLREARHVNLINLLAFFRKNRRFYLVFEFMDFTALNLIEKHRGGVPPGDCRRYMFQVCRGVEFLHRKDIIHRDIKPENLLMTSNGIAKLCDFGFARKVHEEKDEVITDYVATRWYRAPEIQVRSKHYGKPVDVWAIGCLLCELLTTHPLLPGQNDVDQIYKTCRLVGAFTPELLCLAKSNVPGFNETHMCPSPGWNKLRPKYSALVTDLVALSFVRCCMSTEPSKRYTASQLIWHPYYTSNNFQQIFMRELREKFAEYQARRKVKWQESVKRSSEDQDEAKPVRAGVGKQKVEKQQWSSGLEQEKEIEHQAKRTRISSKENLVLTKHKQGDTETSSRQPSKAFQPRNFLAKLPKIPDTILKDIPSGSDRFSVAPGVSFKGKDVSASASYKESSASHTSSMSHSSAMLFLPPTNLQNNSSTAGFRGDRGTGSSVSRFPPVMTPSGKSSQHINHKSTTGDINLPNIPEKRK